MAARDKAAGFITHPSPQFWTAPSKEISLEAEARVRVAPVERVRSLAGPGVVGPEHPDPARAYTMHILWILRGARSTATPRLPAIAQRPASAAVELGRAARLA